MIKLPFSNMHPALKKRFTILLLLMAVLIIWDFYTLYLKIKKSSDTISPIIALGIDTLTFIFLIIDIRQSKIYKTRFFYMLVVAGIIFMGGMAMRHFSLGDYRIFIASACILSAVIYLIYYFRKTYTTKFELLKLVWVLSACIGASCIIYNFISPYYCIVSSLLFYAVFIVQAKNMLQQLLNQLNQQNNIHV